MGYELNKLMRQFGVSTPGAVNYSGAVAPVAPLEPIKDSPDLGPGMRAARRLVPDAEYENAMAQYKKDLAAYEVNKGPQQAAADADRAAYDQYKNAYMGRVMSTPQYTDAQFQAAPSGAVAWQAKEPGIQGDGRAEVSRSINTWLTQNPNATPQELRAVMDKYQISGYDMAQARGGSMWGNALSMPTYQNYTPIVPAVATVAAPVVQQPAEYNYEAARGGAVDDLAKKYAVGGAVRKFRLGGAEGEPEDTDSLPMPAVQGRPMTPPVTRAVAPPPVEASPAVRPVMPPASAPTPMSPAANDLAGMLNRYLGQESTYGPELAAARKASADETKAFTDMIAGAMKERTAAPDKTEMYFRLAAAFGAPTRTGHFTENLGMVGKELGEYSKDIRAAKKADRQLQLQLGLEAQKLRAQTAREDLSTLRTLTGEEMKDKRAILQEYLKSGRPQSEAGKAAVDAGLTQGTPDFKNFVEKYINDKIVSGNLVKEAMVQIAAGNLSVAQSRETRAKESSGKLTPGEVKLKSEAETALGNLDDTMGSLKRAYALNPNTFDGTLAATAQLKVLEQTNPKDPRVLATREQRNLLGKGALSNLKAVFGGNPTEGERTALMELEGLDSKSKEERATIIRNTYKLVQQRRAREQKRLDDVAAGLYRETTPSAAGDLD
jgi:hypothetical protein